MKRLTPIFALLLAAVAVACSGQGPAPTAPGGLATTPSLEAKPQRTNLSVTTTITGTGATADIGNDGSDTYQDGVNGVASYLTANAANGLTWGDWRLEFSSSARGISHSFVSGAVPPSDSSHYTVSPSPAFSGAETIYGSNGNMNVQCTTSNKSMLTMIAGSTITCPLVNNFTRTNGESYSEAPAQSFYPGTPDETDVLITCNLANAGGCSDWDITPIGTLAVARLVQHFPKPPKPTNLNRGDFYMTFHFHVTRP